MGQGSVKGWRLGFSTLAVALAIGAYSGVFYLTSHSVAVSHQSVSSKELGPLTKATDQVSRKITTSETQSKQLVQEYQSLLSTAQQDQMLINQVNHQLEMAGLPPVQNSAQTFPNLKGVAINPSPPPIQTMTGAS